MGLVRNRPTELGRELGECLARFADEAEPRIRLRWPAFPVRCKSCAFRAGSVPNGCEPSLADAMKSLMEKDGTQFNCHEHGREGTPCAGWAMLMLDGPDDAKAIKLPWGYSDEPSPPVSKGEA